MTVRLSTSDAIAEIVLAGPGKGNPMGPDFFRELPRVVAEVDRDDAVRAVIVRADGPHFSFGLDLPAAFAEMGPVLQGGLASARTKLHETILEWQAAVTTLTTCRKPVIAAIHGWCIGGGVDLVTACDLRVCSRDARFSVREVRVAIVADVGSLQRLPYIVGEGVARELAFTGCDVDAERALRIGLVNEVHDNPEATVVGARELARRIADNPPLVVAGIKRVMEHGRAPGVRAGLEYVAAWNSAFLPSLDLGEALSAFLEKRPPKFKGE